MGRQDEAREATEANKLVSTGKGVREVMASLNLTSKQLETIEDHLKYEEGVRQRVNRLKRELSAMVLMLENAFKHVELSLPLFPSLVVALMRGMEATFCRDYCVTVWREMCLTALEDRKTGMLGQVPIPRPWVGDMFMLIHVYCTSYIIEKDLY